MFKIIRELIYKLGSVFLLDKFGAKSLQFFIGLGESFILLYQFVLNLPYIFRDRRLLVEQMLNIGYNSIPLVVLTSIFTGMVSSVQAGYQLSTIGSPSMLLGAATSRAIVLELGPVLTGLIMAGRYGASIAAEIGTMKVTEQIDALQTMAINPVRYLANPRIIAGLIMMPVVVIFANLVAILGAVFIGYTVFDVLPEAYFANAQRYLLMSDIQTSLTKAFIFGGSTALIGTYVGFSTEGGAEGVGQATIRAFVLSSIAILVNDYIVASILLT